MLKRLYTRARKFGYCKGDYIGQPKFQRRNGSGYDTEQEQDRIVMAR